MANISSINMASKRRVSESGTEAIEIGNSKKKQKAPSTPTQEATDVQPRAYERGGQATLESRVGSRRRRREAGYEYPEEHDHIVLPSELEELANDLESEEYTLVLEHNSVSSAKCRARECQVQKFLKRSDQRIEAPYRLNICATRPSNAHWSELMYKPNRRFFHVSCFEEIGLDIAKYMELPPEFTRRPMPMGVGFCTEWALFHPAITDWAENNGKAFDAELYTKYEEALKEYRNKLDLAHTMHIIGCAADQCKCDPPPSKPKSIDFISGEPTACSLAELLVDVLSAGYDVPQPYDLYLLELHWMDPAKLSTMAKKYDKAEAEKKVEKGGHVEETEGTEDSVAVVATEESDVVTTATS